MILNLYNIYIGEDQSPYTEVAFPCHGEVKQDACMSLEHQASSPSDVQVAPKCGVSVSVFLDMHFLSCVAVIIIFDHLLKILRAGSHPDIVIILFCNLISEVN